MPFFSNKFSPKKPPIRKSVGNLRAENSVTLIDEDRVITLKLGDQKIAFKDGQWQPETGHGANIFKSNQKLQDVVEGLEEENNMLKLKIEILFNMLAKASIQQ